MNTEPVILELEEVDAQQHPNAEQRTASQSTALAIAGPAAIALQAVKAGMSIADMREMLALQKEWEANEALKAFREDFAALRGENIIIPKTKHVDRGRGGSFDQAEYDEVCRRLSPALARHGFSFRHDQKFGAKRFMRDGVENDEGWVWVTCYLEHRKGHSETLTLEGPPGEMQVNTPAQNMQVTASYLKRQSLLAITGTATGGEDDENRMRKRGDDQQGEDAAAVDQLLANGREAAMEGMASLLKWWGALSKEERDPIQRDYPGLRKAAQEADAVGAHK